ncbi:MAG TPA: 50S ribosomal protein L29 [Phycisphaerales bacterium]|nr:50S ribosomal protein L29 [Phycisphaerales bacterium]
MTGRELRAMKEDELKITLAKTRGELFDLKTKRVSENVEDTSRFGKLRKDVARMLTEQRSRSVAAAGKSGRGAK